MSNAEFETTNKEQNEEILPNTTVEIAEEAIATEPAAASFPAAQAGKEAANEPVKADEPVAEIVSEEKAKQLEEARRLAEEKQKQFDASFVKLKNANDTGSAIEVLVKDRIKGGLRVMFDDVPIFLPTSQFSLRRNPPEEELAELIGKIIKVYIHELTEDDENRKTVIVSRKKAIVDEIWNKIKVGDIVEGTVSSIASFGIFLDIGGVEGLIHISRLSQIHVADTKSFAQKGDKMHAVVVEIDREKNRLALSKKDLEESPWLSIEQKFPVGTKLKGIVRRFTSFGAYVEIQNGIDGLLRISELSWTKRVKHPSEIIGLGQEIEVEVINVSGEKNTLHISLKKTVENPWHSMVEKFTKGKQFNATVKQVMTQGCVLTIENEVDGFMPRSKMRHIARGKKIPYSIGEVVEVLISDVVPEQESIIIEPKLDEEQIAIAERENSELDEKNKASSGQKRFESKKTEQIVESASGSFSLQDLLTDKQREKLLDNIK